jgi:hypothetical protein
MSDHPTQLDILNIGRENNGAQWGAVRFSTIFELFALRLASLPSPWRLTLPFDV